MGIKHFWTSVATAFVQCRRLFPVFDRFATIFSIGDGTVINSECFWNTFNFLIAVGNLGEFNCCAPPPISSSDLAIEASASIVICMLYKLYSDRSINGDSVFPSNVDSKTVHTTKWNWKKFQSSFKTVLKHFRNSFVSVSFRCADSLTLQGHNYHIT